MRDVPWRAMSQAAEIERSRPGLALYAPKDASRLLARVPAVDAVGLEERASSLAKRSIKRESKLWALDLAIRCMDLTTLEGTDTVGKVIAMCAGRPPEPGRSVDPGGGGRLPVSAPGAGRARATEGFEREGRERRRRVPLRPRTARGPAGRDPRGRRPRRARGRHRPQPLVLPGWAVRPVLRGDRGRSGRSGRRAPQGDPGDGRARLVRSDPPGVGARDGGRGRFHQDLDGQDRRERDAPGGALHDGGGSRLLPRDRPRVSASRSPEASGRRSRRSSTSSWSTRRSGRSG